MTRCSIFIGFIDVGNGCWRRNVLVAILKCWWRFCHFSSLTSSIFLLLASGSFKGCYQYRNSVTNIKSLTSTCYQHLRSHLYLLEERIWIFLIVFIPSFSIPIIYLRFSIYKRQKSSNNKWFSMIWIQSSRFFMLNICMFNLAEVGAIKPMTIWRYKINVSYLTCHICHQFWLRNKSMLLQCLRL